MASDESVEAAAALDAAEAVEEEMRRAVRVVGRALGRALGADDDLVVRRKALQYLADARLRRESAEHGFGALGEGRRGVARRVGRGVGTGVGRGVWSGVGKGGGEGARVRPARRWGLSEEDEVVRAFEGVREALAVQYKKNWRVAFTRLDLARRGTLTAAELAAGLQARLPEKQVPRRIVDAWFLRADVAGQGKLGLDEFTRFFRDSDGSRLG